MTWSRVKPRSATHGSAHDKARKAAALLHEPWHPCVRCGEPLGPMGKWLHYDHHDTDKTRYLGFAHQACNLKAAGHLGNARQKAKRQGSTQVRTPPVRAPRNW